MRTMCDFEVGGGGHEALYAGMTIFVGEIAYRFQDHRFGSNGTGRPFFAPLYGR